MKKQTLIQAESNYRDDKWLRSIYRIELTVFSESCFAPDIFGTKFDRDVVIQWVTNDRIRRNQPDLNLVEREHFYDLRIKRVYNRATLKKKVSKDWRDQTSDKTN